MNISSINQENEEITKTDCKIESFKIEGKYMAAELSSVVLLLRRN